LAFAKTGQEALASIQHFAPNHYHRLDVAGFVRAGAVPKDT